MILVTGATGFVGRRLMRRLVQSYKKEEIVCLAYDQADNYLEQSGRAILDELGVKYIPVDLVSGRGLENVPKSPDLVIHVASNTTTGDKDHSINDVGARNLINCIRPLKPNFHLVFTSTISVSDHREKPNEPCDESSVLKRPFSEYGRRKLIAEGYFKEVCEQEKISLSILRLSGIHGKGPKPGGLFDSLVTLVKKGSILSRFDYPGRISVGYVDDVADALVHMSQTPPPAGKPELHIFAPESPSVAEMSEAIHKNLGVEYRPIRFPAFFWAFCRLFSRVFYALEPVVPHYLYNRIWQLTLLMNNGYDNRPKLLQSRFPGKKFRTLEQEIVEMCK